MTDHVNYPHEPGRLYDCPACEAECFCTGDPGHTECVFCESLHEHQSLDGGSECLTCLLEEQ